MSHEAKTVILTIDGRLRDDSEKRYEAILTLYLPTDDNKENLHPKYRAHPSWEPTPFWYNLFGSNLNGGWGERTEDGLYRKKTIKVSAQTFEKLEERINAEIYSVKNVLRAIAPEDELKIVYSPLYQKIKKLAELEEEIKREIRILELKEKERAIREELKKLEKEKDSAIKEEPDETSPPFPMR